jgi:hypothetical protein
MKVKFVKPVSVDFFSSRLQEWIDRSFDRNQVVEVKRLENISLKWTDLLFENGDVASDVASDSFITLP